MDGRPTWTDCDEAGDYVVPNLLSPRDLVSRPDNMDETVPHTFRGQRFKKASPGCVCTEYKAKLNIAESLDQKVMGIKKI